MYVPLLRGALTTAPLLYYCSSTSSHSNTFQTRGSCWSNNSSTLEPLNMLMGRVHTSTLKGIFRDKVDKVISGPLEGISCLTLRICKNQFQDLYVDVILSFSQCICAFLTVISDSNWNPKDNGLPNSK